MNHSLGQTLPLWSIVPFVAQLAAIALGPLVAPTWWSKHSLKVSVALGVPVALFFLVADPLRLARTVYEYIDFILLIGTLFIIAGGILVRGAFPPTPWVNAAFLGTGAVLANLIGTTGASMLLVRPLLRANARRPNHAHVIVFFIFLVSNIGGLLTPLGDPPLYLGYLEGVPFFWTLRLWPAWLLIVGLVLAAFCALDVWHWRHEPLHPKEALDFNIRGARNLGLLAGVVAAVFLPSPLREVVMAPLGLISYHLTPPEVHSENGFSFGPIIEVATLFVGIFLTMMPVLLILEARGAHAGLRQPWEFFWVTGGLSSFLDNAPTYLAFLYAARGLGLPAEVAGAPAQFLAAISLGAVCMGANTYIGNGPNFMVKFIAEENGVPMPNFFGYMLYSGVVLLPVFAIATVIFFR